MRIFQESDPIEVDYCEEYGLREYLSKVNYEGDNRCEDCYRLRLRTTAHHAKEKGFDQIKLVVDASAWRSKGDRKMAVPYEKILK